MAHKRNDARSYQAIDNVLIGLIYLNIKDFIA